MNGIEETMMFLAKLSCLLLYASALAGWGGAWSGDAASAVQAVAILILAIHALEIAVAFKYVRLYRGPLAASILLTLLFGLLHLWPIQRQARRAAAASGLGT